MTVPNPHAVRVTARILRPGCLPDVNPFESSVVSDINATIWQENDDLN